MKYLTLVAAMAVIGFGLAGCDSSDEPQATVAVPENPIAGAENPVAGAENADVNVVELRGAQTQDTTSLIVSAIELGNFKTLTITPDGDVIGKPINPNLGSEWKKIKATSVRVIDGDTVEVLIDGKPSERVRLLGIDAPESKQSFGDASKATLEECVAGAQVTIAYKEIDRYDRMLGKVFAGNTDCNYRQVVAGSAWHYKQYSKGQPNDDADIYADAEKVAQLQKQGLWSDLNAQEPWNFRKEN